MPTDLADEAHLSAASFRERRWLYGPWLDFLTLRGGSLIALGAIAAFFPRDEPSRLALAEVSAPLFGLAANLMFFTVGWHYAKQGYGILMLDDARKGMRFGAGERRRLLWNTHLAWFTWWLVANDAIKAKEVWGITYYLVDRPIVVADKCGSADRHHSRSSPEVSKETNHAGTSHVPDMVVRERKIKCSLLTPTARAEFTYPYGYFLVPLLIFLGGTCSDLRMFVRLAHVQPFAPSECNGVT